MRKILNYLLGEELVSEQSDKGLWGAAIGLVCLWVWIILGMGVLYVVE